MIINQTDSTDHPLYQISLAIRKEVFITEQGISPTLEINEEEDSCHFVLSSDNQDLATCRIKSIDENTLKLQRFAVRKNYRKKGYGKILLQGVESFALKSGYSKLTLSAQEQALPFYLNQGYNITGSSFIEVEKRHYPLAKRLKN